MLQSLKINVKENIVLTATFDVTQRADRKIFNRVYPRELRHGEDAYKRYVYNYISSI